MSLQRTAKMHRYHFTMDSGVSYYIMARNIREAVDKNERVIAYQDVVSIVREGSEKK